MRPQQDWAGLFVLGCLVFLVLVVPVVGCVLGKALS